MKITIGPRRSGKTARTIMESAKTGSYILVATKRQADCVYKQAKEMEINIPYPVTISEVTTGRKYFDNEYMKEHGVLVDEAQLVLQIALCDIPSQVQRWPRRTMLCPWYPPRGTPWSWYTRSMLTI